MKKLFAVLAVICVIAASGCGNDNTNNNNNGNDTTTTAASGETADTSSSGHKVTQIAYEAPEREDTTADALKYLEQNAPLYYNYLKVRRSVPLTFETIVTNGDNKWETGIYFKDENNFAQYSKNPDGSFTKVIYMKDKAYQIDSAQKVVYTYDCGEEEVKTKSDALLLKVIYLDDVAGSTYSSDTAEYEGTEYDRLTITTEGIDTIHYFEKSGGKLAYTTVGETVSKVTKFESSCDDSIFEIPSDYETKTYDDLKAEVEAKQAELQAQMSPPLPSPPPNKA